MILCKEALHAAIDSGHIIAEHHLVQENSINVELGAEMWLGVTPIGEIVNLHSQRRFHKVEAIVYDGIRGFMLYPEEMYLGTTLKEIGTVNLNDGIAIVPEMRARSTTGRHGLTVAMCAGVGDVGYNGRWALEIKNNNSYPVFIAVGTVIAQCVFYEATPTDVNYQGEGRYQKTDGSVSFLPRPFPVPNMARVEASTD